MTPEHADLINALVAARSPAVATIPPEVQQAATGTTPTSMSPLAALAHFLGQTLMMRGGIGNPLEAFTQSYRRMFPKLYQGLERQPTVHTFEARAPQLEGQDLVGRVIPGAEEAEKTTASVLSMIKNRLAGGRPMSIPKTTTVQIDPRAGAELPVTMAHEGLHALYLGRSGQYVPPEQYVPAIVAGLSKRLSPGPIIMGRPDYGVEWAKRAFYDDPAHQAIELMAQNIIRRMKR